MVGGKHKGRNEGKEEEKMMMGLWSKERKRGGNKEKWGRKQCRGRKRGRKEEGREEELYSTNDTTCFCKCMFSFESRTNAIV